MKRLVASMVVLIVTATAATAACAIELAIAAAESLAAPMMDIARDFEAANPGTRLRLEFAASDAIMDQIVQGAPIDVFIPADEELMDRIEPMMLAGTRRDVALNRLVLIVPPKATPPASLGDLARLERISIANPQNVPAGRYAKAALERAQLWTALTPKLVNAPSERQVRDRVAVGEADAGFVYATDAAAVGERVKVAFNVPTVRPIRYPAAVVRTSQEASAARAFVEYLRTPAARQVFVHYGFADR